MQIIGTDRHRPRPIMTDSDGRLVTVTIPSRRSRILFQEEAFLGLDVTGEILSLPMQNTATKSAVSYAVINRGDYPTLVMAEISPNSIDFSVDQQEVIAPQSMRVIVPNRFLKWTRLSLTAEDGQGPTQIDVYYQSQTVG
ncbi:hypothetical protein SD70_17185 [Gordoniibacillus kamchatkensis]|uniref:DUF6385 domain-containing protein n=1 Tax=Gordoniibacillus kamchatkensis TaxID=1590651 RepID=A0ABR5AFW7_9BACL|nr:hypothetical protein SD70_17185 [Paenibacillus sp. VKM B-2647]